MTDYFIAFFISFILTLIALIIMTIFHEFGHYLVAKIKGLKPKFVIVSIYKIPHLGVHYDGNSKLVTVSGVPFSFLGFPVYLLFLDSIGVARTIKSVFLFFYLLLCVSSGGLPKYTKKYDLYILWNWDKVIEEKED